jgi:hypothetical protein
MPYYCIARGGELWFEKLDLDAFYDLAGISSGCTPEVYLQKYIPRPFVRGGSCGIASLPVECFGDQMLGDLGFEIQ